MMRAQSILAAPVVLSSAVHAMHRAQTSTEASVNPIRKVVTLLQAMQSKVEQEGKKEAELHNKFMCYCGSTGQELKDSIAAAENKISALTASLEAKEKNVASLKLAIKKAQEDRDAAERSLKDATTLREKESTEFATLKAESDSNVVALNKAIAALKKGMAGFLQTSAAADLKLLLHKSVPGLYDMDRQVLTSFLDGTQSSDYVPASSEIVGILKQLAGTMGADLREAEATEKAAAKTYSAMVAAKTKEIDALASSIETKMVAVGEASVAVIQMKDDLADTKESLTAELGFSADLAKGCDSKAAEWDARVKTRSEEIAAISETIKVLSDDDALELFKKTLPGASAFVQMETSFAAMRLHALEEIQRAQRAYRAPNRAGLDMISLALRGRKVSFDKVVKMIDSMVQTLKNEQLDDDHKLEYCNSQLDIAVNNIKELKRSVANAAAASEATSNAIETVTLELSALETGVKSLDRTVADATEQRKSEHAEFQAETSSNAAAKELLAFAKNRLNKFYAPKLYSPPANVELSAEDRLFVSHGGSAPAEAPAGGIAGTGISAFVQVSAHKQHKAAPPPPPETFGAYATKSSESNGVIAMMDLLIKDIDKEMQTSAVEEKNAQEEYEQMMKDAAAQRVANSKAMTQKSTEKAELEGDLEAHTSEGAHAKDELSATAEFLSNIHGECDWLLQYADARKAARDNEISNLNNAKAVLNGADYSF